MTTIHDLAAYATTATILSTRRRITTPTTTSPTTHRDTMQAHTRHMARSQTTTGKTRMQAGL